MTYQELVKYLFEIKDDNFALFSKRLSNSKLISIGVKTPVIRKIIKEHVFDEELKLNDFELEKYLEVDSIYFGLGLLRRKTYIEQAEFLDKNLIHASSWAITDTLGVYMRKCSFEDFLTFYKAHFESEHLYTRRFSYVFALKFASDKRIVDLFPLIKLHEDYMVTMAEAWLLSFAAINYQEEVFNYLSSIDDKELIRKTISKICDSYRFEESEKNKFKSLREGL